ncbi:MAG: ornithine carbamoyltransferase [Solobacterium sp.]|nr:ornithine carbamoyltransferase [Solobacterium sp.]
MNLKGKDFLTLLDFTSEEINELLTLADELKRKKKAGIPHRLCEGKNIALIFEKTSTRTRCAFEVAASDLGMGSTYLGPSGTQIGIKESIADTARVLAGMYDAIEYRGFGQEIVNELAKFSSVPVINGLTNEYHPTQVLADLMTIREHFGTLKNIKLVYLGDARYNMGNSLLVGCAKMGVNFTACAPEGYMPGQELIDKCRGFAKESGAVLEFESDPKKALKDADVVYTDIWVSMGEPEEEWAKRIPLMRPYQVNSELMSWAKKDAVFMHCLPSYHDMKTGIGNTVAEKYGLPDGIEVTDEVFESEASIVFQEAENRMHTIKAVIASVL